MLDDWDRGGPRAAVQHLPVTPRKETDILASLQRSVDLPFRDINHLPIEAGYKGDGGDELAQAALGNRHVFQTPDLGIVSEGEEEEDPHGVLGVGVEPIDRRAPHP